MGETITVCPCRGAEAALGGLQKGSWGASGSYSISQYTTVSYITVYISVYYSIHIMVFYTIVYVVHYTIFFCLAASFLWLWEGFREEIQLSLMENIGKTASQVGWGCIYP